MKTSHTPGPWRFVRCNADLHVAYKPLKFDLGNGKAFCLADESDDEDCANARLIAAAPELLAALENARNVLAALATGQLKTITPASAALNECRTAIAKATGAQPDGRDKPARYEFERESGRRKGE